MAEFAKFVGSKVGEPKIGKQTEYNMREYHLVCKLANWLLLAGLVLMGRAAQLINYINQLQYKLRPTSKDKIKELV